MEALAIAGLLIYTCGAFAFGMTFVFWLGETAGAHSEQGTSRRRFQEIDVVNGLMLSVSVLWFCVNAAALLLRLGPRTRLWQLDVSTMFLAFTYPPLIMHTSWAEVALLRRAALSRVWRAVIWPVYAAALIVPVFSTLVFLRGPANWHRGADRILLAAQAVLFVGAAVYSIALIARQPAAREPRERRERRSYVALFALMAVLFLVLVAGWLPGPGAPANRITAAAWFALEIATKSLPLMFIFVGAYFENRFDFFDLFVKRGVALLASVGVMAGALAAVLPLLGSLNRPWVAPWIYAVALLPAIAALPWIHGRIATVLDRRWLGRRFTPAEAITRFLTGLKSATNEAQLESAARDGLSEIFGADCAVDLDPLPPGTSIAFPVKHEVPVQSGDVVLGRILMGPRSSEAPYFSEDAELLTSLADVLGSVLVNLRLQEARKEQEQRSHELSLHASRSELKALRAQINPHFLFNALNAIAGLIHRNPRAADRTIEQLADVFRYALGGAESEWAALGDEVEFVKAYLEVERARFGDRLHADVSIAEDVRAARVPTMAVQTLVENAVKHGLSELRGPALVRIDARRDGDTLVVSVIDNGPGFTSAALSATHRAWGPRGGYGLTNIRQRLHGYFGDGGALTIDRDSARAETVVSLKLPLVFDAATDRTRGVSEASDVLAPQPESGR